MTHERQILAPGRYHFVGVAGVGMSAVAQAMVARGFEVTGSDRYRDEGSAVDVLPRLEQAGVRLAPQDGSAVDDGTAGVVVSTAIEDDNADLAAARELGTPVLHRSEALAGLAADRRCVAVTGTSGKSTVTGMIGWILAERGMDPTVVNGAAVLNWRDAHAIGNFRRGGSELIVFEADESDRSLLCFHPDWAVVTNASHDHFGLDETLALFETFSGQVREGLVSSLREPGLLDGFEAELSANGSSFRYGGMDFNVPVPGRHNVENALLAVELCRRLGMEPQAIAGALASFRGMHRRLERVGDAGGATVFDDYAHNPAKVKAAWQALAPYHGRVVAVWRPHGFGPLRGMMEALADTFGALSVGSGPAYILPVYDAGGTADRSVGSDVLVDRIRSKGGNAEYVADVSALPAAVARQAREGDVVLVMGARDPGLSSLARSILAALESGL